MQQISEEQLRELKQVAGEDATNFAYITDTEWVCVCGTHNPWRENIKIHRCSNCERRKEFVLENYRSIETLRTRARESEQDMKVSLESDRQYQASQFTRQTSNDDAQSVINRYTDAYLVAQTQTAIGGVIKTIGIILGVIIFLTGLVMLTQIEGIARVGVILSSAVLAIAVGVPLYVLGIHASAQGQILKAILDGTVTSSPFLTEEQMKQVMSLR